MPPPKISPFIFCPDTQVSPGQEMSKWKPKICVCITIRTSENVWLKPGVFLNKGPVYCPSNSSPSLVLGGGIAPHSVHDWC
ncbi:hypothetical protein AB205_0027800 [Aquarana catesbeiana]|uniref:Uncharacterized protein n=1 Tax=Aquarana catesbeiana TaxID=8400 RepID=A0A2G9S297_AQUCT|nr:hypothetical protein AB205_0027800 [Aquarana catesbeiana]